MDTRKAERAGLILRPIADTVRDVFEWDQSRSPDILKAGLKAGLSSDRQSTLLKTWSDKGMMLDPAVAIAPVPVGPEPTQSQLDAWMIEGDD